jgi:hypothetical protein
VLAIAAFSLAFGALAVAQKAATPASPLITQSINDSDLVTLAGNTRPEAKNPNNDRGPVADDMPMPHMMLQLRRPAAQEQALQALIDQLHDPKSPNYHHWLTASEIGTQFGPAASDIATVTAWLGRRGFAVNLVYPNAMVIDFSGTAANVRSAFHTDIHNLAVNGAIRFANTNDPQIPAALAPAVAGVVGLHDIPPRHSFIPTPPYTVGSAPRYRVTPSDLATIYNFNPLYAAGYSGQGQTIYLLENSNLYNNDTDWYTFRSALGLSSAFADGSLTTIHPPPPIEGLSNCTDPYATGNADEAEATVDAEWSSAAAPSATIVIASCTQLITALQNLVNANSPPAILSISANDCEAAAGATMNAMINSAYQMGVARGMSILVSSSDNDAAMCDNRGVVTAASNGIAVNGWASTPYNVAVGGTDFSDTYSMTNGTYWSSHNTATYGSALSYIPEIPWNSSCASQLLAQFNTGSSLTYGTSGFCNTTNLREFLNIVGGSGGPSGCATGAPSNSTPLVVSGTCEGWPKPSWQGSLLGNPTDGVRDIPDVSLFASNGIWNHAYVTCYSDTANNGVSCASLPSSWKSGGGTSISAPIFAGIQALVNQYTGSAQGNPNPVLYKLAAAEYGTSGSSNCLANNGNTAGASCIFYDVTMGDNDADCISGTPNCYAPSGTLGVLSTSTTSYQPAYPAQPGWDFATGIGSVNVYNLVTNWAAAGGGSAGLTVNITGSGTVTSNPAGIACAAPCSQTFADGTPVTLTPTPAAGWAFSGWSGACGGSGACIVAMQATAATVTATFVQEGYAQQLNLALNVSGSGVVTSSPAGVDCPSTCSVGFAAGTQVALTAVAAAGGSFNGWGGACSGVGNCVVTMNTAQSATATFAQTQYTLDVSVAGNGRVIGSPTGISCPSVCTMNYSSGTPVMLTATPTGGATFNGWGGACSGNGSCLVTMNSIESVTAMFSAAGGGGPSSQTFVSATLGSDANPCTRMSPCLTFTAALAQTTVGGEIDVLDPGDFGPVTITKAITIFGNAVGGAAVAGTIPSPGTSGIVVSAGSGDTVNLRGLIFDGVNASGTSGIVFNRGARLNIQNCVVQGFTTSGITLSPGAGSAPTTLLDVLDTTILNNATGLLIQPTGGIAASVALRWLRIDNNTGEGLRVDGTAGSGAINATLADSTASFNASNGIDAVSGPGNATLDVMRVVAAANGSAGIQSNQSGGGTASITVGSSVLYGDTIAAQATGGASLLSYGNNQVTGNVTNGSFTGGATLH